MLCPAAKVFSRFPGWLLYHIHTSHPLTPFLFPGPERLYRLRYLVSRGTPVPFAGARAQPDLPAALLSSSRRGAHQREYLFRPL